MVAQGFRPLQMAVFGSGSSAITALAVLTDGQMIVGNGSTDPVAESGTTLRTSIGVGTGDSPQFTDLTLTDDLVLNSDSAVFSMGDGADFSITHDGTTGASIAGNPLVLTMTDNTDPALSVKEGSNEYMVFDTTNGTEGIGIGRGPTNSSRLLVDWPAMSTSATGTYIKNNFRGNNGAVTMGDDMTTMATVGIHEPNVTLNSNTLTNAASLYIGSVATEATNNYAIWVDAGVSRFDGNVDFNSTGELLNIAASGNEWKATTMTQTTAVSDGWLVFYQTLPASSTGAAVTQYSQGDASGSANNMSYYVGYDAGNGYMKLRSRDTDGSSTDADIWRILDGQLTIDANSTWDDNAFDAYDDVALLRSATSPTAEAYDFGSGILKRGKDVLIEIGVLRKYPDDEDGFIGYNDQRMAALLAGGIYQNRSKIDEHYEEMDRRLKAIGA